MKLLKLNDMYLDLSKISYIGEYDTQVKAHIGVVIHYFPIILDGHFIELKEETKDAAMKLRNQIIDNVNRIEGYLP